MSEIWEHSKLSGTPLLLLLSLADHANDDRVCWPSVRHIAEKCRMTDRHARRLIHQLAEAGHLEIQEQAGPHGTNLYRIPTAQEMQALSDIKQGEMGEEAAERLTQSSENEAETPDNSVPPDKVVPLTRMSATPDTDVPQGVSGMSVEPSLNHHESSDSDTNVSHAERAPASDSAKTLSLEQRQQNAVKRAVREHFEARTRLTIPTGKNRKGLAVQWWNPIREVCELADYDLGSAKRLIDDSLKRLEGLTIADPNSILKTARAIVAEKRKVTARASPEAERRTVTIVDPETGERTQREVTA